MALFTRMFVRALSRQKISLTNGTSQSYLAFRFLPAATPRFISTTNALRCEAGQEEKSSKKVKSRVKPYTYHSVETGLRYMDSLAYSEVYGDLPVWTVYRRNFKGVFAPKKTRITCIHGSTQPYIDTGSPCPICRDEYLVVHHLNTKLLEQFICPHTGKILTAFKTGVCQKVQFRIELEIMKAYDLGLMEFDVPLRSYQYSYFYPQLRKTEYNIV